MEATTARRVGHEPMSETALGTLTFWTVLAGCGLLGITSGVMGCFALLRRQSLLGDALAHAALPGVCVAFMVSGSKHPVALLCGALIAGLIGALLILIVVRGSRIKEDSAIGIVLSVFFAVGIVLLTFIQRSPAGNQSGLDHFLFGQAAGMLRRDIVVFSVVSFVVLATVVLLFKELKLLCFDRALGTSIGLPMATLEVLVTVLLVAVVVIGLQTVGVVLMVASLIVPAAAARQWTNRLGVMVVLSAFIGGAASTLGVIASATAARLPTGPAVVLVSSAVLAMSLVFAPNRGLLWEVARARRLAARIKQENLLKDLYAWGESARDWSRYVALPDLMGMRGSTGFGLRHTIAALRSAGQVEQDGETLRLTKLGQLSAATIVRKHRLWELYLTRRLDLPSDHVHRDAEAMEHALSDEMSAEFDVLLGHPTVDPHGRPIPPLQNTDLS